MFLRRPSRFTSASLRLPFQALMLAVALGCSPQMMLAIGPALPDAEKSAGSTPMTVGAVQDPKVMLFGGSDHDVYLGCLSCSKFASDSLFNKFGTFGNSYNSDSIFNKFGLYGSKYSPTSPCNPYASDPPVVVDDNGDFYGYLTMNRYHPKRVTDSQLLAWLAGVCAG